MGISISMHAVSLQVLCPKYTCLNLRSVLRINICCLFGSMHSAFFRISMQLNSSISASLFAVSLTFFPDFFPVIRCCWSATWLSAIAVFSFKYLYHFQSSVSRFSIVFWCWTHRKIAMFCYDKIVSPSFPQFSFFFVFIISFAFPPVPKLRKIVPY